MIIEKVLSGIFFLLTIITNVASERFGYKTFNDLESEAKLQWINENQNRFKTGVFLILIEHVCIIVLATLLFISFSQYNMTLAVVWTISRTLEGIIQIYYKKYYWGLLNIARQYSGTSGAERNAIIDSGRIILKTKDSSFSFAQLLFSVGTLAYSTLFVIYGVVPALIGWFGIVASTIYGLGNVIFHIKPNFKIVWNIGGLLILLFEIVLGGWLIINTLITH